MPTFESGRELPELNEAGTLNGTELVVLHQNGVTSRLTLAELAQYVKTAETIVPASEPFRGARLNRSANHTLGSLPYFVPWNDVLYDTHSFWNVSEPTRLTIPAGISKVRLAAGCSLSTAGSAGSISWSIHDSDDVMIATDVKRQSSTGFSSNMASCGTGVLEVSEGDYFQCRVNLSGISASQLLSTPLSFFSVEVVELT
ncbi:hypothetical protein [Roseinatronobacter alkalisoli]|uniref:Ig-like domain-containing protein n=1 Tax=Roseinatronobacter alkalisoli TaxID=3028235 RepID=A0ABT5TEB0_9RHOB|nr:hypothetical protein [Roseinatronobacter sp. HJB301]MDD7973451.1 hypothetical protein [Roseinatronobacter sp. HJB301]